MLKNRKSILHLISLVKNIKERYANLSKDIINVSSQLDYNHTIAHYDHVISEFEKELQKKPIGYRYTGVYYLKNPYTMPAVFEKHSGSIFMQEHLVSWQIENEPGKLEYPYYRAIYKEPEGALITLEDATPVYSKPT